MNKINWTESLTPKSVEFSDIYYNINSGLEEKEYVFVEGNNLKDKFNNLNSDFNILELGFGTGLSFLVTALSFIKLNNTRELNFTSTELYPLSVEQIEQAFKVWKNFYNNDIVQEFLSQYKKADLTADIMIKIKNVNLRILIGDANIRLKDLKEQQNCFFLDGFAPGKNESMWSEDLFNEIKRLSKKESTFATYSASRIVKDRVEQAGFEYSKRKGFGSKRDMLVGIKNEDTCL